LSVETREPGYRTPDFRLFEVSTGS
jgi:hypothetical protein